MVRKIASWIYNGIIVILGIFLCICIILYFFGIKIYVAASGSMEPTIMTGAACFVDTGSDYSDIKIGYLIAYEAENGALVTHRAIAVNEDGIETKGDANDVTDGITATDDNFVGKTVFSIPKLGYFMAGLQTKRGRIIAITAVMALIIFQFL